MPREPPLTRTVQDLPHMALPRLRLPGKTGVAVNNPDELPDGWYKRVEQIAGRAARNWLGPQDLPYQDRRDAALDAIIEELAEYGWPDDDKRLFHAANNAMKHHRSEHEKHLRYWAHWFEPSGTPDAIGESVTDKIGVRQLAWAFTPAEWEAVSALAKVMAWGGGITEAAALLGIEKNTFNMRLKLARRRARELWIVPGETPFTFYRESRGTRGNYVKAKRGNWTRHRTANARREDKRAVLAHAVMSGTAKVADVPMLAALTGGYIKEHTIRRWIRDGLLPQRGLVHNRLAYSVDEFVRVAVSQGRISSDPRKQAA